MSSSQENDFPSLDELAEALEETVASEVPKDPEVSAAPSPIPQLKHLPLYVSLEFSPEISQLLRDELGSHLDLSKYPVVRHSDDVAHTTLIFNSDLPLLEYHNAVAGEFLPFQGQEVLVKILGYAQDEHCVCYRVQVPEELPVYPKGKNQHITMALNGKKPFYSNLLLKRLLSKGVGELEKLVEFEEPFEVPGTVRFKGALRLKKKKLPWM